MRRIAADEHAALGEVLGDERVPRGPRVARQHFYVERRADRLLDHRGGIDTRFVLVGLDLRVEGELALAIDRRHERAPLAVEAHVHPGRRVRHTAIEVRHAAIDRVHAPADEVAHYARLAGIAPALRLAHEAARAIGADDVVGPDLDGCATLGGLGARLDVAAAGGKAGDAPAIAHRRDPLGIAAQELLDELLRDAMRQLGRAPG